MARGIGPGDEVITSPYTFFATAGSIWRTGAKPVFVDIEPDTYNIDPARIEAAITPRTRVIIPVHLYGQTADMDPIREIARKHGLFVLEDAAQAIGAAYKGQRAGSLGDVAALSFYPSKNLGGFGDGGMIVTDDPVLGRSMARLRVHGMEPKYYHHEVGINSRLDAIQAAVLRVKLRHLDEWTLKRREAASRYRGLFEAHGLTKLVGLPRERDGYFHVLQPVRHPRARSAPRPAARLSDGPPDRHGDLLPDPAASAALLRACWATSRAIFPIAESAARETLALPIYPELSDEQQRFVVGSIRQYLDAHAHAHLPPPIGRPERLRGCRAPITAKSGAASTAAPEPRAL